MRVNIALLTVTDTRTFDNDKSGGILVDKIKEANHNLIPIVFGKLILLIQVQLKRSLQNIGICFSSSGKLLPLILIFPIRIHSNSLFDGHVFLIHSQ